MADIAPAGLRYPFDTPPVAGSAAIEVAPGVLWLRMPLPMKLDHVNIYAFDEGDSWTIIDTGFASKKSKEIWAEVLAGPLGGKPVSRVVVTHHHPDHIGLAGWFQTEHGAELVTTRTAWLTARMLTLDEQEVSPEETLAFYRLSGMDPEMLEKRRKDRPFNFCDIVAPLPLGFTRVKQGDCIRFGGRDWDVHMGNGHAPEHATFWSRDDNLVLAGDQILSSISPNVGVYPTEPMADPIGEWLEACERLAPMARADHLVLGGHKLPFTGLPKRMEQLIENHHGALKRLAAYIDRPKSASECFSPLFKRKIGEAEYGLALVEAVAHLSHLYQSGLATRELRAEDGAWVYQSKG
ncbi:MBL fold metallo-hydrolase [Sulfitobacter sp. M57]|uniref:MBL fold metallo-hydrolase n=1 Tax=unclassified Sulfitobacter TaxID=196795 RepID=UPI0023E26A31|nr:MULTISPECIES: MBL fold metallo-hydrolase [unclassified Sulfitobacter]MDF3415550.1 MBL fold metallo-hydrolase [Sulfitobacter sp. KE5]MDF3423031.1 MBL fold metallo-hydrolase [Sulfitobacter sp. KE43]MDF3434096.1 MBL fold metallo-hydrolase [Sulfitobacter sp. KE42]MDF3459871.1 MBL fold metallo-hydrolase [Sulfitobacter sp. S74]MDF3463635.1 MBL fold metallo-hydrolase [Sulfitobacter sp. Ks18]